MDLPVNHDQYRLLGRPVLEEEHGERLDYILAASFPFLSRAAWQKKIQENKLLVRGRPTKASYRIKQGDYFHFYHPQQHEPEVDTDVYPIWRQGGVMAVYKPSNLPMHENGPYRHNTFAKLVREKIGSEWSAVHRLDRETSGIVLCGNTPAVRQKLSFYLSKRRLEKEYLAIARGVAKASLFREQGPIGDLKESAIRIKKWVVPDGLPSETLFEVVEQKENHTLLRAFPKTGRTNQIRIHAAFNGLPLVGDKLYHPDENVFLQVFESGVNPWVLDQIGFHRLCLHAARVQFVHPENDETCEIICPLPSEMQELWENLP